MQLTPWQIQVAKCQKRFRTICAGRRAGKTVLSVEEMVSCAAMKDGAKVAYIAPTYQQARDIAWDLLVKRVAPIATKINESRLEITLPNRHKTESKLYLRGWESVETLRGQAFDLLIPDEVAMMRNFWAGWNEVLRPTLTDRRGMAMFISTPKGFNHFYDLCNATGDEWGHFQFTTYDNPHIPKSEIEDAKRQLPGDTFDQEYMADFRRQEGLVYREFIRDVNDVWWVVDEWYKTGKVDEEIADYVWSCKFNRVYCDPEAPSTIESISRKGVQVSEVVKNRDSIINGIDQVRVLFKQGKLKIHRRCKNLISELESYRYPDKKDDKNPSELPVKESDHACFTLDTPIEIPHGVEMAFKHTGKKQVYEFMGAKVTADHPYLTQRGFVRLDALRYDDRIVVWRNKSLMELRLGDTQKVTGVSFGTTLHLLLRNVSAIKLNAFTGMYGKSIMEKYPRATMSTISTVTRMITIYLTSNWLHLKNTTKNITKKCCQRGVRISNTLASLRLSGIRAMAQKSFTLGLQSIHGIKKNTPQKDVKSATRSTKHHSQPEASTATIIAGLKQLGEQNVYATTTSSGWFVANGVVVSNCDALRYVVMMSHTFRTVSIHDRMGMIQERNRNLANNAR